ncbi:hypothetical protein AMAG_18110 [Allomyces macrogynus ATCC 38327]|uniref:Calcium-binding protein 39 n=1 Tax=Allomyces macrogynus (strain ATCC 38327) TaxID=578462 RepID=A0A0L0S9M5_ALLM3|nr:hypothetical protein AMAG_18110 [Allomyces macrogynus ATCC 38327]|eukprot:KNE59151.1 hypothetical protein AMAG_18110 [Allomyces macrogynus ATCC 38327]
MSFLFNKYSRPKTPGDLVRAVREFVLRMDTLGPKGVEEASRELARYLAQIKYMVVGTNDAPPSPEVVVAVAQEIYQQDLLTLLITHLIHLDFETKKTVAALVTHLMRLQMGHRYPTVEYFAARPDLLAFLIQGYENPEVALNCGVMVRECARSKPLAKTMLAHPIFWSFFSYVQSTTFDTASDAFVTFRDLLTRHTDLATAFLDANYDAFFERHTQLMHSTNYVTKRQSIRLLGELLTERSNHQIMMRYLASTENLKVIMNLFRDQSRNIQFEAFHPFKLFVANPRKTRAVADILIRNRDKLMTYISNCVPDMIGNQPNEDKMLVLEKLAELSCASSEPPSLSAASHLDRSTVSSNPAA